MSYYYLFKILITMKTLLTVLFVLITTVVFSQSKSKFKKGDIVIAKYTTTDSMIIIIDIIKYRKNLNIYQYNGHSKYISINNLIEQNLRLKQ
jgi:hypothetical protein